MRRGFLFAGQGAQTPGMACELQSPRIKELFEAAESVRPGIRALMQSGTMEELSKTVNTQPCMFVADLAYAYAEEEKNGAPTAVCGFSVGEIPALVYAGALSVQDGLRIICKRAELMQSACEKTGGAMIAAVGLDPAQAEEAAASSGAWAANYNAPKQTVIAVTNENEGKLTQAIAAAGGRAIKLKVSGAFHCPLLQEASEEFAEFLRGFTFAAPRIPVYANLTAQPYGAGEQAIGTLAKQMCSPVRFTQTVANMRAAGVEAFIEVGPGRVLTNLVSKM
ncbi:MAG: ACP S-malonyltransferase [Clostridiales bacterium]|nr:ACP S-malonyltransferase [Clostridiales bacterium]